MNSGNNGPFCNRLRLPCFDPPSLNVIGIEREFLLISLLLSSSNASSSQFFSTHCVETNPVVSSDSFLELFNVLASSIAFF